VKGAYGDDDIKNIEIALEPMEQVRLLHRFPEVTESFCEIFYYSKKVPRVEVNTILGTTVNLSTCCFVVQNGKGASFGDVLAFRKVFDNNYFTGSKLICSTQQKWDYNSQVYSV